MLLVSFSSFLAAIAAAAAAANSNSATAEGIKRIYLDDQLEDADSGNDIQVDATSLYPPYLASPLFRHFLINSAGKQQQQQQQQFGNPWGMVVAEGAAAGGMDNGGSGGPAGKALARLERLRGQLVNLKKYLCSKYYTLTCHTIRHYLTQLSAFKQELDQLRLRREQRRVNKSTSKERARARAITRMLTRDI